MSVILESLLDYERRAECRVNDKAVDMGRPIIANPPTNRPVERNTSLHPARGEYFNPAQYATNELG
jgi:hypothetical protein